MSSVTVEDAQPSIAPEIQQHEIPSQSQQTSTPQPSEAPQEAQHAQQAAASAVAPSAEALPALFWDSMPEEGSEHSDSLAMNAMMAELGPVDKAINFKVAPAMLGSKSEPINFKDKENGVTSHCK